MGEEKVIYVDFRRRCRVDAMPDDPLGIDYERLTCQNCPLAGQCFWLVKLFKKRLCPFYPFI